MNWKLVLNNPHFGWPEDVIAEAWEARDREQHGQSPLKSAETRGSTDVDISANYWQAEAAMGDILALREMAATYSEEHGADAIKLTEAAYDIARFAKMEAEQMLRQLRDVPPPYLYTEIDESISCQSAEQEPRGLPTAAWIGLCLSAALLGAVIS